MEWYLGAFRKFATFTGRARRKEYWMFFLINLVVSVILGIIGRMMGSNILASLYSLVIFLPGLALTVRRLHDTNRSGWWLLIALIPVIGAIVLLVFTLQEGTNGPNEYGPDPKGV